MIFRQSKSNYDDDDDDDSVCCSRRRRLAASTGAIFMRLIRELLTGIIHNAWPCQGVFGTNYRRHVAQTMVGRYLLLLPLILREYGPRGPFPNPPHRPKNTTLSTTICPKTRQRTLTRDASSNGLFVRNLQRSNRRRQVIGISLYTYIHGHCRVMADVMARGHSRAR